MMNLRPLLTKRLRPSNKLLLLTLVIGCGCLLLMHPASADDSSTPVTVNFEVPIGQTEGLTSPSNTLLIVYIQLIYQFIIAGIGVIAAAVIVYHGVRWALAAGNEGIIGKSKEGIVSAIIGVVLALLSYVILNALNPALVSSEPLVITKIAETAATESTGDAGEDTSSGACPDTLNVDARCTGLTTLDTTYITPKAGRDLQLLPAPAAAVQNLAQAFYERYNKKIQINWAFRSIPMQQCYVDHPPSSSAVAKACYSNHNGGSAVDISANSSALTQKQYNWLVCGNEESCTCTTPSGGSFCKSNVAHYGFRVLNYNSKQDTTSISEQHHFDYQGSNVTTDVCQACPGITECGCD